MRLPIGYDDFKKLIINKLDFVDKSLLIKDVLENDTEVILITRPRRFGKTLNLSMLEYFLKLPDSNSDYSAGSLFDNLKITEHPECMKHQGKYPVIAISFKDVKFDNFEMAYKKIVEILIEVHSQHPEALVSDKLVDNERLLNEFLLSRQADRVQVEGSLKNLSICLHKHYGIRPFILIDEYDSPIQASFRYGYYDEMIAFMRGLFGTCLKGNNSLQKGILTGIMRVSRESLFSGLNNLEAYSLLRNEYSQYFGFTENEVNALFEKSGLENTMFDVKDWYNGYQVGDRVVYNPWSVINCIKQKGELKPYWVNTSDNALVRDLLIQSSSLFKAQFERLLQGESVEKFIDENMVFGDLKKNESAIWGLLLMTGYLKVISQQETDQGLFCQLAIPNREVRNLYRIIIEQWLSDGYGVEWYNQFLNCLLTGNIEGFVQHLRKIMVQTISVFDMAQEPESFYHGFMLGLSASLDRTLYEIKSNRESGHGRYDVVIIPKNQKELGIIFEFKHLAKSKSKEEEDIKKQLQREAEAALKQIENRGYAAELKQRGLKDILKIGLAFCGKHFELVYKRTSA